MRLTILLLSLSFSLTAQSTSIENSFRALAEEFYQDRDFAGGAYVTSLKDGRVIHSDGYGMASEELRIPISDSTVFDLASIAKMFTGYAIATLEEEGRLSASDNIRKYLPGFPDYGMKITVAHLLHHTSGVRNWTELIQSAGIASTDKLTFDRMTRLIYAQRGLDFTPGEKYKYSNSGYVLLAQIVEKVTGSSLAAWSQENIFLPLEMYHTRISESTQMIVPNLAQGYRLDDNRNNVREAYNSAVAGSSSLLSTGPDMAKWMSFLLNPATDRRAIVERMMTTRKLNDGTDNNYAYGISVESYRGTKFITHSGSWASFTSALVVLPELNAGVFFAHNFRAYTRPIANAFVDLYLPPEEATKEEESTEEEDETLEVSVDQRLLDEYIGTYKLGTAWYLTVTDKDGKLYVKANGENTFPSRAINDSTFVVRSYGNRSITFLRDENGKINALFYSNKVRERSTDTFPYDQKKMEAYAGTYYNHSLGLLYELKAEKDGLYVHSIKDAKYTITHTGNDEFFGDGALLRIIFSRNSEGTINGFYISNTRGEKKWFFDRAMKSS